MITKIKELIEVYNTELGVAKRQVKHFGVLGNGPDKVFWKNRIEYLEGFISELKGLMRTPQERIKDGLIKAMDGYISILNEEISSLAGIAIGWKSVNGERRQIMREKIQGLKEKLK